MKALVVRTAAIRTAIIKFGFFDPYEWTVVATGQAVRGQHFTHILRARDWDTDSPIMAHEWLTKCLKCRLVKGGKELLL